MACPASVQPLHVAYLNFYYATFFASVAWPGSAVITPTTCHVVGLSSRCVTNQVGNITALDYVSSGNVGTVDLDILAVPHVNILATVAECLAGGSAAIIDIVAAGESGRTISCTVPLVPGQFFSIIAFDRTNSIIYSQHTWISPKCEG